MKDSTQAQAAERFHGQHRYCVRMLSYFSRVQLFAALWTVTRQVPLSMGFSRQEYWSLLPFPSPADIPNPGIKPGSPTLQADSLPSEPLGRPNFYLTLNVHM